MDAPIVSIFDTHDLRGDIARAGQLLNDGKLVVLPTETVYGVAARIDLEAGRAALESLRPGQPAPLVVHVADPSDARLYVGELGELAARMTRKLWPGPVGLVFDVPAEQRKRLLAELNVPEDRLFSHGAITLRCPDHPLATEVIAAADGPVALTRLPEGEAGEPLAQTARRLGEKLALVFDAGPSQYTKPSTLIRVRPDGWEIVREGIYDRRIIERQLQTSILFVCSGNTCRSPMAKALARKLLAEGHGVSQDELVRHDISVDSAGTFAVAGVKATPQAVTAVAAMGGDLASHRSQPLSVEAIHRADAIFAMGKGHRQSVLGLVPSAEKKTMLLDPNGDIDDPIGGSEEHYRQLAGEIERLLKDRLAPFMPAGSKEGGAETDLGT